MMISSYTTPQIQTDLTLQVTMPLRDWRRLAEVAKGTQNLNTLSKTVLDMIEDFERKVAETVNG